MKIKEIKKSALTQALQVLAQELDGIDIYTINDTFSARKNNEALRYGVNWGAHGTVEAVDAIQYAKSLTQAAKIAEVLTSLEIESSDIEADDNGYTVDQFHKEVATIKNLLTIADPDFIKMWMEKEVQA